MEDGERREDASMRAPTEEVEERKEALGRARTSPPVKKYKSTKNTRPLPLMVRSLHQRKERSDSAGGRGPRDHPHLAIDYGFLEAKNPNGLVDEGSNPSITGAEAKYGLTLVTAVRALQLHGLRSVSRTGWMAWATREAEQPPRRGQRGHREEAHQNPEEQHGVKPEENDRPVSPTDTTDH